VRALKMFVVESNKPIVFTIPGNPVGKGRARSTASGIHYTPEKTRNYEAFVKMLAVEAMKGRTPIEGACVALIGVDYPIPKSTSKKIAEKMVKGFVRPTKKPDIDNIVKAIFDSCNGVVFLDDSQVVDVHVFKAYSETAKTFVSISEIELC